MTLRKLEAATQASCITEDSEESFTEWFSFEENLKTCNVDIDEVGEEDFTILSATDLTTLGFRINNNPGVKFLPTNLFRVFPDLLAVEVWFCSVTSVNGNHFKNLSKLKFLNLDSNEIEHISDDAFVDLVSLETLDLGHNRIKSLSEYIYVTLEALESLFLHDNEIEFLHPKTFSSLVNLKDVDFDRNEIASLDENIFENTTSLEDIRICNNKLETIPKNLFKNNLNLESVWLNENNITSIDGEMLDHLPNLNFVALTLSFCGERFYFSENFEDFKKDLKKCCTENWITEVSSRLVDTDISIASVRSASLKLIVLTLVMAIGYTKSIERL